MMLDLGAAWDDMVLRIYGDGDKAKQIFNNRFYHYLSRELAGSQELIAGEALLELYESGGYEKIVLDTPPSIHAIDFLEAPERIIGFLANETVLGFLNKHGKNLSEKGSKWVASAGGMLQSVVQKIIGKGFFLELVDFFVLLQDLIKPLTERTKRFQELIKSQACEFQIIFSPEPNSIREAEVLQAKLDEKNYRISRLVANRVLPKFDGVAVDPGSHSAVRDDVRRILEQHEQKFDYEQELLGEFKNNKTSLICLEALACDIQSEEGMSKLLAGLDK